MQQRKVTPQKELKAWSHGSMHISPVTPLRSWSRWGGGGTGHWDNSGHGLTSYEMGSTQLTSDMEKGLKNTCFSESYIRKFWYVFSTSAPLFQKWAPNQTVRGLTRNCSCGLFPRCFSGVVFRCATLWSTVYVAKPLGFLDHESESPVQIWGLRGGGRQQPATFRERAGPLQWVRWC